MFFNFRKYIKSLYYSKKFRLVFYTKITEQGPIRSLPMGGILIFFLQRAKNLLWDHTF